MLCDCRKGWNDVSHVCSPSCGWAKVFSGSCYMLHLGRGTVWTPIQHEAQRASGMSDRGIRRATMAVCIPSVSIEPPKRSLSLIIPIPPDSTSTHTTAPSQRCSRPLSPFLPLSAPFRQPHHLRPPPTSRRSATRPPVAPHTTRPVSVPVDGTTVVSNRCRHAIIPY